MKVVKQMEQKTKKKSKGMRINTKIIEEYLTLQKRLPNIIASYGMTHKYIYTSAGIAEATYFRKLKSKSFDGEEMLRIAEVINR